MNSKGNSLRGRSYNHEQTPRPIINHPNPKVSVVIPARNESRTIASVIKEASKVHPQTEVIVVENGSTDETAEIAESMGARLIRFATGLGHDVGRAIGAKEARGDIVLFTDGDFVVNADQLIPFVEAVEQGIDVAINKFEKRPEVKQLTSILLAKRMLNSFLSFPELGGCSMTTIPHALSRKALEVIGYEQLAVPPKAQAIALWKGLIVKPVHLVEVGSLNRKRRRSPDPIADLIIGDHLEAIHWVLCQDGDRGKYPDLGRQREKVRD